MLKRFKLEEGSAPLVLVWLMVLAAAYAIQRADLMVGLNILPYVTTIAVVVGYILSRTTFSSSTAHLISLVYGLTTIVLLVGSTELPLRERILDLINRQVDWLTKAFSAGTGRDGLVFVMHTSGVFWLLAYTATWYTFRQPRVWRVVLPTGLVLLSVVYYYFGPEPLAVYLAIYFLLALTYVARTHLVAQEKSWRADAVRYESGIRYSFLRASVLSAILAMAIAFSLPTLPASAAVGNAFKDVSSPWQEFQNEWTRMYSSLRSYGVETNDAYSDTLPLGGPRSVGNTVIMDIIVPNELPNVYWQGIVFDRYEDGRWHVVDAEQILHFPDDGPIQVPNTLMRQEIVQQITNYVPNAGTLYGAPDAILTDRQMFVGTTLDNSGRVLVASLRSRFVLRQNEVYTVRSRISAADATSLRQASTTYPDWVRDNYLQLPATITLETVALATELAAPYDNAFDKAIAIRNYLRENITYNDQIDAPPPGVDPVHYVLFERPEGYCNYYASAMVIMLRSQGIPARMVAGYAQGKYDPERKMYRVVASNAHTWAEVYFPQYGWIQFEPTAALPIDVRPEGSGGDAFDVPDRGPQENEDPGGFREDPGDIANAGDLEGQEDEAANGLFSSSPTILYGAGAIVVVALAYFTLVFGERYNKQIEGDIDKSYSRLANWASRLGINFRPVHTPFERAELLAAAVPEGRQPIINLTNEFVVRRFARENQKNSFFSPLQEWKMLRPLLLRQTIRHYLPRWLKPKA
ncbi:MAG: transglutaminase domain-containing protein [Chloroflexi bacterium]|nr:transglutaminase domain-containing protein [Chloroflexota bacterium]MBP8054413.1 transglutaminase domain-containing protein [Chloroflexota bacterium]